MRLGAYPCSIIKGTLAHTAYNQTDISERHRHRYEFNNAYRDLLTKKVLPCRVYIRTKILLK